MVSRPRERGTAGPVSYTWVARSRSESTSQFTALALNKPSSSSSSSSSSDSHQAQSYMDSPRAAHRHLLKVKGRRRSIHRVRARSGVTDHAHHPHSTPSDSCIQRGVGTSSPSSLSPFPLPTLLHPYSPSDSLAKGQGPQKKHMIPGRKELFNSETRTS